MIEHEPDLDFHDNSLAVSSLCNFGEKVEPVGSSNPFTVLPNFDLTDVSGPDSDEDTDVIA